MEKDSPHRPSFDRAKERMPEQNPPPAEARIYVASLADEQFGNRHGAWIDATQDPDAIREKSHAMLRESPVRPTSDSDIGCWAIRDSDGFKLPWKAETRSLEIIVELARGVTTRGGAYAMWALMHPTDLDGTGRFTKRFDAAYLGYFDPHRLVAGHGWPAIMKNLLSPAPLRPYDNNAAHLFDQLIDAELIDVVEDLDGTGVWLFLGDRALDGQLRRKPPP